MSKPVSLITSFYNNPRGGMGRYENEIFDHVSKFHDFDLNLVRLNTKSSPELSGLINNKILRSFQSFIKQNTLPTTALKGSLLYHFSHQLMGIALLNARIIDRINNRHTPFVITVHDLFPAIAFRQTLFADIAPTWNWRQKFGYNLNLFGIKLADRIIADSYATAQDISRILHISQKNIRVIYLGFHPNSQHISAPTSTAMARLRAKWHIPRHTRIILYVGSQDPRKNLATLISSINILRDKGQNITLVIAGGARVTVTTSQDLRMLSRTDSTIWTGHINDTDLADLYCAADVFAFPSRFEGFGFPPLEAMAYGCPVIASRSSCIPEVVGDAALLVDPTDIAQWVTGIEHLLSSQSYRNNLIEKGRVRANLFTWQNTANKTIDVYRELL